ncbi:MAG: TolC family protein [Gammaproteobacteria bacterium]|nr:TolC family protein [Gammaproteobacteria bacterium]MCW8987636.1 TolC family protein [Gammaproteobacteria bacterium]
MNKKFLMIAFVLSSILISNIANANNSMELTIYQVMQRVIDRYPSLKISAMEVAQAAEQRQQVESSLGWILNSSAGVTHDLTGLGTPSDRLDLNASLARQLESGATLSLSGGYRYEDSQLTFSPAFPNPAHTTTLDLSYRLPLAQGEGNPVYTEGLISSEAGHDLARANQLMTRITLAEKVKDLFYSALSTQARLSNAKQAVLRARELSGYINKNVKLGLSEDKDQLQAQAQLNSKLADLSSIELQWQQQQTSINRLMLEDWNQQVQPTLMQLEKNNYNVIDLIKTTEAYHPAVKISQAQLDMAESSINSALDSKKDNVDLVVSVGTRTSDGKSTTGTVSEKDWAGTVSIQYKHLFDDKGVSSKYKQAMLEKNIALENTIKTNDDIRYTVSGLVAEIEAARLAVNTAQQKLHSETLKLKEAEYRFRNGRADTAQLIQFQNEHSLAQLAYQTQKIDLNNRIIALQIFSGQFWNELSKVHGVKK